MKSLFEILKTRGIPKKTEKKSFSERNAVFWDIMIEYDKSPNKKKQTIRNLNFFARYIKTKDLYHLLSRMKQSKNPAALFWYYVKPLPPKKKEPPKSNLPRPKKVKARPRREKRKTRKETNYT